MFEKFNNPYLNEEIYSFVILLFYFVFKYFTQKLIRKYARINESLEQRTNLVIKYVNMLLGALAVISIIIVWGVKKDQIFLFISSIFTVAGVAAVAQWSLLSNVTAGIILFFSFPFKIGDTIKIHDKDFPIEAEILDIKAFYVYLKTIDNELITYPNNLLMQKGVSLLTKPSEEKEFFD